MNIIPSPDELDQPRHLLLDRRAGWRAARAEGVEVAPGDGGLRLQALPANGRPLVDAAGSFGGLSAPTGVAVDPWGRIYITDHGAHLIKRFDPCCNGFETLACVGGEGSAPRHLRGPRGIAISADGLLYVADSGNRRVQVFSLVGLALAAIWGPLDAGGGAVRPSRSPALPGGPPVEQYPDMTWTPWDIAVDGAGRVYVSDYSNGLIHCFDRHGRRLRALDGAAPDNPALVRPTHLAVDRDGRLYVVQEGKDYVVVIDREGAYAGRAEPPEHLAGRFRPGPVASDTEGNLYIADQGSARLCCYRCDAALGTAVRFTGGSVAVAGPVAGLAFDASGNPLVVERDGRKVIHLEGGAAFATEGRQVSAALDSGIAGCQWHRVALRGRLPQGTAVQVHTYTAETSLMDGEVLGLPESAWATAQTWVGAAASAWDCLVLSPPGRFLWLRLTLTGTGITTPMVGSAKVYFPRLTSAQYLPAVYRTAPPGSTFLERFLSIFDSVRGSVEEMLDRLPGYFDPDAAPVTPAPAPSSALGGANRLDFLSWLASWLGLTLDGTWSERQKRMMVKHAARLYARRGTPRGLREALLVLVGLDPDECAGSPLPGILEDYKLRRWLFVGGSTLGDHSTLWGRRIVDRLQLGEHSTIGEFKLTDVGDPLRDPFHVYAHRFTVFLPAAWCADEGRRKAVERLIDLSKPAHTAHRLELVQPRFRVGIQATIGMDTAIGRYPDGVVAGEAKVGYDAVLQDAPDQPRQPVFRVGARAQIGAAVL